VKKIHLSEINEKDRPVYIREEALNRVINKLKLKLQYINKELLRNGK
jgi:hypothetical protein